MVINFCCSPFQSQAPLYKPLMPIFIDQLISLGVTGRGVLGKWGPNHAADPVVTRWKRSELGEFNSKIKFPWFNCVTRIFQISLLGEKVVNESTGKPILEFVCIQRRDTGIWAIPGGMVDPGEKVLTEKLKSEVNIMFYLNTIEPLFLFVEQLDDFEVVDF